MCIDSMQLQIFAGGFALTPRQTGRKDQPTRLRAPHVEMRRYDRRHTWTSCYANYECGFNAFDDARMKFDVRFYLVSILFIIFDLEVAFLFPWAVAFKDVGLLGFWSMMVFLAVLTIGFAYEWKKGALEWE